MLWLAYSCVYGILNLDPDQFTSLGAVGRRLSSRRLNREDRLLRIGTPQSGHKAMLRTLIPQAVVRYLCGDYPLHAI